MRNGCGERDSTGTRDIAMLGPVRKGERQYMVRSQLESTYGGREVQKKKALKKHRVNTLKSCLR